MHIDAKLLGALLLSTRGVFAADEEPIERCLTSPKVIIGNLKSEYHPPSTAMPPLGTVILEFTVTTDGTILDVLVVEPVDGRRAWWAIEEFKNLTFVPVSKACRTRLTLTARIKDAADGA